MPRTFRIEKPNTIEIMDETAIIEVTRLDGKAVPFLIDRIDVPKAKRYQWFCHTGYCCTMKYGRHWPLTWELFGQPSRGYLWHHISGDRTDNRKSNICPLPCGANNYFKRVQPNRSTGRRGVSIYADGSIVALIGPRGRRKSFKTLEEAISARKAYEKALSKTFFSLAGERIIFNYADYF